MALISRSLPRLLTAWWGLRLFLKNRCCGGSLISEESLVLTLLHKLLKNAVANGAQCLVTPCPLCQTNLDAYQGIVGLNTNIFNTR
ncbi:heterodisulfide reductase-related iron-sulfur binding cluster [Dehalococcoidales bacterium]|nr:heterodisulfide reductase-related iron-sulfur binding cluster [Dehalococcoidales bacterium]